MRNGFAALGGAVVLIALAVFAPPALIAVVALAGGTAVAAGGMLNRTETGGDRWKPSGVRNGFRAWNDQLESAGQRSPRQVLRNARSTWNDNLASARGPFEPVVADQTRPLAPVSSDRLYERIRQLVSPPDPAEAADRARSLIPDQVPPRRRGRVTIEDPNDPLGRGPAPATRNFCAACGHPARSDDPLILSERGTRVHMSHVTDPDSGLYEPDRAAWIEAGRARALMSPPASPVPDAIPPRVDEIELEHIPNEDMEGAASLRPSPGVVGAHLGYIDYGGKYRWIDPDGHATPGPEGFPESPAARRFLALRRSGYIGAIDQDGYRVDDPDAWVEEQLARNTDRSLDTTTPPTPGTSNTDQEDTERWVKVSDLGIPYPGSHATREEAEDAAGQLARHHGSPVDVRPASDFDPTSIPTSSTTDTSSTDTQEDTTMTAQSTDVGTGGRASIAGLVVDWESSVEARQHPETFIAWLQAQEQAARHRAQMVPDLVQQFHGRGPSGHAGVPDNQIDQFAKAYEDATNSEADGYAQWAQEYASYVEEAEEQMTKSYGAEVIRAAHDAHSDAGGNGRAA